MNTDFLARFLKKTPAALAIVRSIEAKLFNDIPLVAPVLDIGCGDGLFVKTTFPMTIDAGIDLDHRELRLAKNMSNYRFPVRANVGDLPFPNNYFRTVISNCVFEHIEHFEQAFSEIYRVLQPGGLYIFTAHSHYYNDYLFWPRLASACKLGFLGRWYTGFINSIFRHFNCFSPETWTGFLQKPGFKKIEWKYYLTKTTLHWFDVLLPLSAGSYFLKKLTGKWVILPRQLRIRLFYRLLHHLYENQNGDGAAIFFIAQK